jgi:hypothetical protein
VTYLAYPIRAGVGDSSPTRRCRHLPHRDPCVRGRARAGGSTNAAAETGDWFILEQLFTQAADGTTTQEWMNAASAADATCVCSSG